MGTSQSKCSYCQNHESDNHSSYWCEGSFSCTCKCNVGGDHDVAQKTAAIAGGVGAAVGGVALTVLTGGIGGMALGAGVSSATNGITAIAKKRKNECCFLCFGH
eukprot:TCONS_00003873-protein